MDQLKEAVKMKQENGTLSQPALMRKLKISAEEALTLMEQTERFLALEESQKMSKLKKIELHLTAEYE